MGASIIRSKRLELRRTAAEDLLTVIAMEQDPDHQRYIQPWSEELHVQAMASDDHLHLVMVSRAGAVIGFVIVAGLTDAAKHLELKRIVVADKGKGYGKEALKLMMAYVFHDLKGSRMWLDVYEHNERARYLYSSLGFREDGPLTVQPSGVERLVVMSVLENEYFAHKHVKGSITRM